MITLQQRVEIPADHRLFIDVPEEIPAGTATLDAYMVRHHANGARELAMDERARKEHAEYRKDAPGKPAVPLLSLRGSCKGLDTMDAYFERKRADKTLEEALELV